MPKRLGRLSAKTFLRLLNCQNMTNAQIQMIGCIQDLCHYHPQSGIVRLGDNRYFAQRRKCTRNVKASHQGSLYFRAAGLGSDLCQRQACRPRLYYQHGLRFGQTRKMMASKKTISIGSPYAQYFDGHQLLA